MRSPRPQHVFLGEWMNTPSIRNGKTEFLLHAAFGTTVWCAITSVLFRCSLLQKTRGFRPEIGPRADEEWTLRASLASDIAFVPGKLATFRMHSNQATQTSPEASWIILQCIQRVLSDSRSGIPETWKLVPRWREEITTTNRNWLHEAFPIYRWYARRNPKQFLNNLEKILRVDPKWFLTQATHGFGIPENEIDSAACARRLIETFKAPWPPKEVKGGW